MYSHLKRAASAFLAAALVLTLFPAYALAAEAEEDGIPGEIAEEELPGEIPAEEMEIPLETSGGDIPEASDSPALLYAEEESGTCGSNVYWKLSAEGTLTIYGEGEMSRDLWPWQYTYIITKVVIESGVTNVGKNAFSNHPELTSVTIPESVTSIGDSAFYGCSGLTSAGPIGGGYAYEFGWETEIPDEAFANCSGLTNVTIPESVTAIGHSAFSRCSGLTSIAIPKSVTTIDRGTFSGCSGLTSVAIPEGVTVIGDSAFYGCSGLTSIAIPENVTTIGDSVFSGCSSLTSIAIPESVTTIGKSAFYGCSGLTSVTIPQSITSIGLYAFRDCASLTSVTIPKGVTTIERDTFSGCSSLTAIEASNENIVYSSIDGVLFNHEKSTLLLCPEGKWGHYNIPEGVTSIRASAFSGCASLTGVTIPEDVTSIGSDAFSYCSSLASVTIPEGVTSIGSDAFSYCSSLASVTIPKGVTTINSGTFHGCSSLASITIPESVTSIGGNAFLDCSSLTSITIPKSVTSFGTNVFGNYTPLKSAGPIGSDYDYKFGWTDAIPQGAFSGCGQLTSVTIPEGVKRIGQEAFSYCKSLTSVTIPEGATFIGWGAFKGCSGLASVTIPEGVTSIGGEAFYGCSGLTSVTIPESVTTIESSAFCGCSGLTSIAIPGNTTSIRSKAFYGCSGLTGIIIPSSVSSIGESAFSGCRTLKDVYFGGSEERWGKISGTSAATLNTSEIHYNAVAFTATFDKQDGMGVETVIVTDGGKVTAPEVPACDGYIFGGWFKDAGCSKAWDFDSDTVTGNVTLYAKWTEDPLAASGTHGENLTWSLGRNGTLTISGTGEMASSPSWRIHVNKVTKVVLEQGITSIGSDAFQGCSSLTGVTIPEGVTSIGLYAFKGCSSLANITIPEGVTTIGREAFRDCTSLTDVAIPGSVTAIGDSAFYGCSSLASVTIQEGVTSIGEYAFKGCGSLISVTIPGSVTSIRRGAFEGCGKLADIAVEPENTVFCIVDGVLFNKDRTHLYSCLALHSAVEYAVPDGVTYIRPYAFEGCSSLTSVTIPSSVGSIGEYAFYGCSALTDVYFEGSKEQWNEINIGVSNECLTGAAPHFAAYTVTFDTQDDTEVETAAVVNGGKVTEPKVPVRDGYIFDGWFKDAGCSEAWDFESDTVTGNVTLYAKWTESPLVASGTHGENLTWTLGKDGTLTISGTGEMEPTPSWLQFDSDIRTVVIGQGVTSIGDSAFPGCTGLTGVTIPESVTSIGDWAFLGCTGLTGAIIPEGVTAIGREAFFGCTSLTGVTIPGSVTSIGDSAFLGCTGLTGAIIPEGVTVIGREAFFGCTSLTGVTIPGSVTSIGDSAFLGCTGLTSATILEGVTTIGCDAFRGCTSLTGVTIPGSVTSIGDWAFLGCTGLTGVTIPEGVTVIGYSAFAECSGLTSVTILGSLTEIYWGAFDECSPDLCIYCYSGSRAETYATESYIRYSLLPEPDISTWLTTNASSGIVAGVGFVVRAGYSAQKPVSTLQINLPENIALSSVWLDGEQLPSGSYTRENGLLTVPVAGLLNKTAHTLHLYCAATDTGSYSISGTLALLNGDEHALGTTVVQAAQARLNAPEKIGYTSGIIATGKTAPGCAVTLFVDGKEAGKATTNDVGSWQISFNLDAGVESGSVHTVRAKIQLENGGTVETASAEVTYQACAVKPVKVTMYNTGDHGAQETVFDFTNPEAATLIRYYRIWPSRYPSFTFKAEFSEDASNLSEVYIVTVSSAGTETKIKAVYDGQSAWVGTCKYTDFQDAPVLVYVVYSGERICSNKLSMTPIMDPSGYVYEAVPSNRLSGVTAMIICQEDGENSWNAGAFDQINPQITGADGSYYWDVPAGNWKVSFTKEGYTSATTDWLTVPPPQVDINVPMVSTAAPEVKCAAVYEDYAEITFSQYMDIGSVQGSISLNGTPATVEALDAEDNTKGTQYATRFKATTGGLSGGGNVELTVSTAARNYAGTSLADSHSESCSVEVRPTGITAPETVTMEMSAMQNVNITLVPNVSGRKLTIENLTPAIIDGGGASVTTDENGGAAISVEARLPGTGILRISEPVSGLEATVSVQVEATAKAELFINASIADGILTYSIQNAPEQLNAKLIVASYNDQHMSAVSILENKGGTWTLPDTPAASYVLFLVESDTWKPLCPKVTAS